MSRIVRGYDSEGHKIFEDLGPAENVQWGSPIGGRPIEERPSYLDRRVEIQRKYREGRKRGENLR